MYISYFNNNPPARESSFSITNGYKHRNISDKLNKWTYLEILSNKMALSKELLY